MKTYNEVKNEKPVNWYEELNKENIDWEKLLNLSHSWVTCACGNQCDIIPRREDGAPKDIALKHLGYNFFYAVADKNKEKCLEILNRIEKRSSELINYIQNENNGNLH